jgi:hypothetical protein
VDTNIIFYQSSHVYKLSLSLCDVGLIVNAIPRPKKIPVVPVSRLTLFFSAHPIVFLNTIDRATLFSPSGCGLLVQRAKMASVVAIMIEPNCLNSSVGTTHL